MNLFHLYLFIIPLVVPPNVVHRMTYPPALLLEWTDFARFLEPGEAQLHNHVRR